jgi:hypothetical protein
MLEKIFTEDLTSKDTFFYPCSGMDVEIISDLLNKKDFFPYVDNFILVDLNHDDNNLSIRGIMERSLFFENRLGLSKIKILEKEEYKLSEIESLLQNQLKSYNLSKRFIDLTNNIVEPKAIRYNLSKKGREFTLYLFHYEATILSEKIASIKPHLLRIILKSHIGGAFEDDFFIKKMFNLSPITVISNMEISEFSEFKKVFEDFNNNNFLNYSILQRDLTSIEKQLIRVNNALRYT